jgi:hypothetical protein
VGGDLLGRRTGLGEEPGRECVPGVSLERCERPVDGRADERMDVSERGWRANDTDADEIHGCLGCGSLVQLGERGGVRGIGVVAEDRERLGEPDRLGRESGKAKRERAGAGPCLELTKTPHVGCRRGQPLGGDPVEELVQEQRVAGRLFVTGGAEDVVCVGRQGRAHDLGRGRCAQGRRPNGHGLRIADEPPDKRGVLARLGGPQTDDEQDGKALNARQQVAKPAKGGGVAPVQVVDREQSRPTGGDIRGQPEQAVQPREGRVPQGLAGEVPGIEQWRRERGRAGEQFDTLVLGELGEKRFEELPDDAIGEGALQIRAASRQDLHPGPLSPGLRLRDEGRLADSGRALDHQKPATVGRSANQRVNGRQLAVALEEGRPRRDWLRGRRAGLLRNGFHRSNPQPV